MAKLAEMTAMETLYEGSITYLKFWNFWVRAATPVTPDWDFFFHDYESAAPEVWRMLGDVGAPPPGQGAKKTFGNVSCESGTGLGTTSEQTTPHTEILSMQSGAGPPSRSSPATMMRRGEIVWAACFSKAHLFATFLGRVLPRWHTTVVSAHHTDGGVPPTASHVYVGVYLTNRWYYLDPTAIPAGPLPGFNSRGSLGYILTENVHGPMMPFHLAAGEVCLLPPGFISRNVGSGIW